MIDPTHMPLRREQTILSGRFGSQLYSVSKNGGLELMNTRLWFFFKYWMKISIYLRFVLSIEVALK